MKLAKFFWFIIVLMLVSIISGMAWLLLTNYENILQIAIDQLHRPDLKNILETKYFTQEKFNSIQRAAYSIIPISLAVLGFIILKRSQIIHFLRNIFLTLHSTMQAAIKSIRSCSLPVRLGLASLVALVLIRSIFYAYTMHPQYDECWNYNYFLSGNILNTFFAYNNYPLHNVVTYLTLSTLPDNTFCMRLPNIVIGGVCILLIFALIKKIFKNEKLALAGAAVFSVLPTVVFYFLFSRGVMFALFFAIIIFYYFFIKKIKHWSKADFALVILFGGLGCFSMISFPLYIMALGLALIAEGIINKDWVTIKQSALACLGIGGFTLILYSPILLGTGIQIALDSGYNQATSKISSIINNAEHVSRNQIGFYAGAYFFLLINIILLVINQKKAIFIFNLFLLSLPFILPAFFGVSLPARAIGFQALAYLLTIIFVLSYFPQKEYIVPILVVGIVIFLNQTSTQHTFFNWSVRMDKGAYQISGAMQEEKITTYYDLSGDFYYFVPSILYHHKINGKQISFKTSNPNSARFQPLEKYKGEYFIINTTNDTLQSGDKEIFSYQDESNHFTLLRRAPNLLNEAP